MYIIQKNKALVSVVFFTVVLLLSNSAIYLGLGNSISQWPGIVAIIFTFSGVWLWRKLTTTLLIHPYRHYLSLSVIIFGLFCFISSLNWTFSAELLWQYPERVRSVHNGYHQFLGFIVSSLGFGVFLFSTIASRGQGMTSGMQKQADRVIPQRILYIFYGFSLLFFLGGFFDPSGILTFLNRSFGLLLLAGAFLIGMRDRIRIRGPVLTLLLSTPYLFSSLSMMSEPLVVGLAPAAMVGWTRNRTKMRRVVVIVVAIILLGSAFSFSRFVRSEFMWTGRAFDRVEAASEFLSSGLNPSSVGEGVVGLSSRLDISNLYGWAIAYAELYRTDYTSFLGPIFIAFIPRIIWPEKPPISFGGYYGDVIHGVDSGFGDSSLAAGLYQSLFLGGGFVAVFIGAVVLGLVFGLFERFSCRKSSLFANLWLFFCFLTVLKMHESWYAMVLPGFVAAFFYLSFSFWIVIFITTTFSGQSGMVKVWQRRRST